MWSNIGSCPQVPVGTIGKELILWECQQSWALGMRQHFNTQNFKSKADYINNHILNVFKYIFNIQLIIKLQSDFLNE